jgi:hypothetical protein
VEVRPAVRFTKIEASSPPFATERQGVKLVKGEAMQIPVLLTVFLMATAQADVPFEMALWPGEGRPVVQSVASALELREQPVGSAKVVLKLAAIPRQRLQFDETRFRTTSPGRLLAVVATTVTGRRLGAIQALARADYYSGKYPAAAVKVDAGDIVEYLQYRAEGTCFVRIAGAVIDADPCPHGTGDGFRLLTEPEVEWWIRLVADDRPLGWLLLTDKTAVVVDRDF